MFQRQMLVTLNRFSKHIAANPVSSNRFITTLHCPCSFKMASSSIPRISTHSVRMYCKNNIKSGQDKADNVKDESTGNQIPKSLETDYVAFENQQRIVQDVNEEIWNPLPEVEEEIPEIPEYLRKRGKTGVFDLGELVEILQEENGRDICAIKIPKDLDYVDFMVIVTARNAKHMHALATFIRRRFKMKDLKRTDVLPRIEGTDKSLDWLALDLGNIALHVFTRNMREEVDLETLWTVGTQFDDLYNQPDSEIVALLKSIK